MSSRILSHKYSKINYSWINYLSHTDFSITSTAQGRGNHPLIRFDFVSSPSFCSFSPNNQYLQKIKYFPLNSELSKEISC